MCIFTYVYMYLDSCVHTIHCLLEKKDVLVVETDGDCTINGNLKCGVIESCSQLHDGLHSQLPAHIFS